MANLVTIYFSKDRPLQLDLALSSNMVCSTDWFMQKEVVIYKASNKKYEKAYKQVSKENTQREFIKQGELKKDILKSLDKKEYVMFVVDDCIFTREYSIENIVSLMEKETYSKELIGFSLRLGKNTKNCYPIGKENKIPDLVSVKNNMLIFTWLKAGLGDFSYPLEVSSSLYRVKDIQWLLEKGEYDTPNALESLLYANLGQFISRPKLACYETSVAFCSPLNKVNVGNTNRALEDPEYSTDNLLKKYESGKRICWTDFYHYVPDGCHQEIIPRLINVY